jgi:hypothetical protein
VTHESYDALSSAHLVERVSLVDVCMAQMWGGLGSLEGGHGSPVGRHGSLEGGHGSWAG